MPEDCWSVLSCKRRLSLVDFLHRLRLPQFRNHCSIKQYPKVWLDICDMILREKHFQAHV